MLEQGRRTRLLIVKSSQVTLNTPLNEALDPAVNEVVLVNNVWRTRAMVRKGFTIQHTNSHGGSLYTLVEPDESEPDKFARAALFKASWFSHQSERDLTSQESIDILMQEKAFRGTGFAAKKKIMEERYDFVREFRHLCPASADDGTP